MSGTGLADLYQGLAARCMDACQIASRIGFFPDRQTRAGGPPGFDHFAVRPSIRANPFEKIKDERLDGVACRRFIVTWLHVRYRDVHDLAPFGLT
ncbi:hypothetical protein [Herbaspirillum huttiense]|uniref:hypothetical protein n=1 Tax=Herbaspirillum huttiense TaxID=863372 RepID=UPI0012FEC043|nr:hypothetical protein [Herbaspirillum huttiense]